MILDYKTRAKDLPYAIKKEAIQKFIGRENVFHQELKILLQLIYPDAYIEILQGANEKGKDIVLRRKNSLAGHDNWAFVVKAIEKLDGKASGKTAEVATQVRQAFRTPAQLTDINEPVIISKVYVVNTGSITEGSKKNILDDIDERPYKNNVEWVDLQTLMEWFTEHYPEFFFSEELRVLFKERMGKIEKFLIEDKEIKDFIEPNIKKFTKTKQELIVSGDEKNDLKRIGEQIFGKKETFDSFLKIVTIQHGKHIILTGDAGSGKSVLVFKIVLSYLNKFLLENANVKSTSTISLPICFRAIDLKNGLLDNFENAVETYYSFDKTNKVSTIIIDGIDEVSNEIRMEIKSKVEAYVALKDKLINTVFTSRTNFSVIDIFENYEHYELMPYETSQAIILIKKLAEQKNLLITDLENSLRELEGQIPFYPLALRLLVDVVEKHKEIPASITELYNRYISMVFGEYQVETEIDKLFEPKIKKEFFSSLAYEVFFKSNKVKISIEDFNTHVSKFCSMHTFIEDSESFIDTIKRTAIIKIEEDDVYFSHKSFLDYFIALFFKENKEDLEEEGSFDQLFDLYNFIDLWEDVVYFYFGLKTKIGKQEYKKLTESIGRVEGKLERYVNTFFTGKLLQYAWLSDAEFKQDSITKAMGISLELKNEFYETYKRVFNIEVPKLLSSINMFHIIGLCYSSTFIRNEVKMLIDNTVNSESAVDGNIFFSTLYILHNSAVLGTEYVNDTLTLLLPKIEKMQLLENTILLTIAIDIFKTKKKLHTSDTLNDSIKRLVNKQKKRHPETIRSLFTNKKNDFHKLKETLSGN
ncbi:MAG: NACHT domain-containing protein [Sulfuricurvum sp.]